MSEVRVGLALGPSETESQLVQLLLRGRLGCAFHRCLDVVDLGARCELGEFSVVVVDPQYPRLSSTVLTRAQDAGVRLIGLAGTEHDFGQLRDWGIDDVVRVDDRDLAMTCEKLADLVATKPRDDSGPRARPGRSRAMIGNGTLTAVWGPPGAPGRTSVAVALAQAASGSLNTILIDGDTTNHGLASHLALVESTSGLIAAVHHAERGQLGDDALRRLALTLSPRLCVLTGLPHVARRTELRMAGARRLWNVATSTFGSTVVDVGHGIDDLIGSWSDSFGEFEQPTHVPAATALASCNVLVAVTGCEPAAVSRMLSHLPSVRALNPDAQMKIVVNRVRKPVLAGPAAQRDLAEYLQTTCGAEVHLVRDEPAIHDEATARGLTPREVSVRADISQVALALIRERAAAA